MVRQETKNDEGGAAKSTLPKQRAKRRSGGGSSAGPVPGAAAGPAEGQAAPQLSAFAQNRLQSEFNFLSMPPMQREIWRTQFTERQREALGHGGDGCDARGQVVREFARVHDLPRGLAVVRLAEAAGRLDLYTRNLLLEELRETDPLVREAMRRGDGLAALPERIASDVETLRAQKKVLVVDGGTRLFYFEGEPVYGRWGERPQAWSFLVRLTERTAEGAELDFQSMGFETLKQLNSRRMQFVRALDAFVPEKAEAILEHVVSQKGGAYAWAFGPRQCVVYHSSLDDSALEAFGVPVPPRRR